MIPLLSSKIPPGLKRQLIVSGSLPKIPSTKSMWVMSSRLMIAPNLFAYANSSAGVSFEENIMLSPVIPMASLSISSVLEEQSQPQPYSLKISIRYGLGVAFTAKYSRKPGFHANASFTACAFSRIPFSS